MLLDTDYLLPEIDSQNNDKREKKPSLLGLLLNASGQPRSSRRGVSESERSDYQTIKYT